jgi:hypothetical protein
VHRRQAGKHFAQAILASDNTVRRHIARKDSNYTLSTGATPPALRSNGDIGLEGSVKYRRAVGNNRASAGRLKRYGMKICHF